MKSKKENLDVKYILKTYWSFVGRYKSLFITIIICGALLSVIGLSQRALFKKITDLGELFARGEINILTLKEGMIITLAIWFGVIIIRSIVRWNRAHFLNNLEAKSMRDLKQHYYNHILKLSYKFHTTHKTGALIARISRGNSALERLTDFISYQTLTLIFEVIVSGITLILIDVKIGLIILGTGILFSILSNKIQIKERIFRIKSNESEDEEKGFTADTLTNIDSIKYYGKEGLIQNKYASATENTKKSWLRELQLGRWSSSIEAIIMDIGGLLTLTAILKMFIAGETTLGTVVFAWTSYWAIINSVQNFMDGLRGYNRSIADLKDLFEYGKIQNEIKDKINARNLEIKEGSIEFENVSFKYHEKDLFKNFNLNIPQNKKIALVGHSGSGKSTLLKLLYRFYDIDSGKIKIDNIDIKEVKQESLRSELSIVPQECVLFDDTIYNNIKFSNPKAKHEEIMKAIKFAQLDQVIKNFPNKEKTIVGERGVRLSGGEKQRVSIARAILANKKILVLDEATSALDSKTEHEIQKDLQNLMEGRTSIIIAHRLSTIMSADLIVVLDKGKIVQQGTHNQLINKPGTYRELWNLQKGGYIK